MCNNKLENEIYALALSISKILANNFSISQLAVIAGFLQALLANISVHIQTANFQRAASAQAIELSSGALSELSEQELE